MTTGISPAELLMGRSLQSQLDTLKPHLAEATSGIVSSEKQLLQKVNHDKRSMICHFVRGDKVFFRNHSRGDEW